MNCLPRHSGSGHETGTVYLPSGRATTCCKERGGGREGGRRVREGGREGERKGGGREGGRDYRKPTASMLHSTLTCTP